MHQFRVRVDFYQTETMEGESVDIGPLIRRVHAMDYATKRVDLGEHFIFLHETDVDQNQLTGCVVKTKMTDHPDKCDRNTGVLDDLGLADHEGTARRSYFLYDPQTRMVLFERHREVRVTAFREAVSSPTGTLFSLSLVMKQNALQRLEEMRTPRSSSVKMARPANAAAFRGIDASAAYLIDLLNEFGGLFIDFRISAGRKKRSSLAVEAVRRVARRLFETQNVDQEPGSGEVQKIVIAGRQTPESATEIIDFFEDRLVHDELVPGEEGRLRAGAALRILYRAFQENEDYLRAYRRAE
jgi:hypothetical protein